jgi:hypothetical protein
MPELSIYRLGVTDHQFYEEMETREFCFSLDENDDC